MSLHDQQPRHTRFDRDSTASDVLEGVDLHGRTVVVTGASSGLGAESVRALADAGARVMALSRIPAAYRPRSERGGGSIDDVGGFDLTELSCIEAVADHIMSISPDGIDTLITAAGVMAIPERHTVGPGWEWQLATNHIGHFVLATRLYPLLARCGGRVVAYSSAGHHLSGVRWDDLHFRAGYDKWEAYGQSKTANSLFAVHFDRLARHTGVRAFALHPGKIATGLQRSVSRSEQSALGWIDERGEGVADDFKTVSQGAATGLWAATSTVLDGLGGLYLEDCDIAAVSGCTGSIDAGGVKDFAVDEAAAERLWQVSAAMTGRDLSR